MSMQNYVALFLIFTSVISHGQVASELSPQSLTLPRLSTAQQNTLPPQQAGNVVFNTDEKKLAVHDGLAWNYISGLTNSNVLKYKNHKLFTLSGTFIVPSGITELLIEAWGKGGDGQVMNTVGADVRCSGGGGGQYKMALATVSPGAALELVLGNFSTHVVNNSEMLAYASNASGPTGGSSYGITSENIILSVDGENGKNADFSFQLANQGVYRKLVRTGSGGGTYPSFKNGGVSQTMEFDVNTGQLIGTSAVGFSSINGRFPGGGGGCGTSNNYGMGNIGAILIHY